MYILFIYIYIYIIYIYMYIYSLKEITPYAEKKNNRDERKVCMQWIQTK